MFYMMIFLKLLYYMGKKLTNCSFLLQITVLGRDPKPIKLFVETQMSEEDKQKGV